MRGQSKKIADKFVLLQDHRAMKRISTIFSILMLVLLWSACGRKGKSSGPKQTLTSGSISISVDESLEPIIKEQLKVFDSSFPDAHIEVSYKGENDCFRDFFNHQARMIITTRNLTEEEKGIMKKNDQRVATGELARGAIAVIGHPQGADSMLTKGQIKAILEGSFSRSYKVVVGNKKSGILNFLMDSLIQKEELPSNLYSLGTDDSVISYVKTHKDAIGLLDALNVFEPVDTGVGTFYSGFRVIALRNDSTLDFYRPYAAYVALQLYPLTRKVYFISHDSRQGLATGFANFMSQQRGQLLFLKARMAPLKVPLKLREVNIVD